MAECKHPLNRLRQIGVEPRLRCVVCKAIFDMAALLQWDEPQVTSAFRTWKLTLAMREDSKDATPLADFVPNGLTVAQLTIKPFWDEDDTSDPKWRPKGRA